MADKQRYTQDDIDGIRTRFAELKRPARQLSTREVIMDGMMPDIEKKLKSGWSYDELVEGLRQVGITVAPNTLRNYVARSRGKGAKRPTPSRVKKTRAGARQPAATETPESSATHSSRRHQRGFAGFDESP